LLFDALNGITIDAIISPKDKGERILAAEHMKHLSPGDLVLLDRGYPAFWLFALILSKGAHFCSRIKEGHWNAVQDFHLPDVEKRSCDQVGLVHAVTSKNG